jgi:chemotaxis protein methyltransferase CheR
VSVMSSLPLSPQVFAILSALVEEKVGLHYELADKDLFGDKVSTRAVEAGFESLLDYYYFLRYDDHSGTELRTLTEALVVGETYFFREYPQLKVLVDELLPPLLACGRSPRIWCAAVCSSGYSWWPRTSASARSTARRQGVSVAAPSGTCPSPRLQAPG